MPGRIEIAFNESEMADMKVADLTERATERIPTSRIDSLNMSVSIKQKKRGKPLRIGDALPMNEDFYAMTFISLFSDVHMLLIAF